MQKNLWKEHLEAFFQKEKQLLQLLEKIDVQYAFQYNV